jgi:hypothetical protein
MVQAFLALSMNSETRSLSAQSRMNIRRIYSDGKLYAEPIFLPSPTEIFECRIDDSWWF